MIDVSLLPQMCVLQSWAFFKEITDSSRQKSHLFFSFNLKYIPNLLNIVTNSYFNEQTWFWTLFC